MYTKEVKLLVLDVDGTLTDGKIYMSEQGELFKAFDIKDGLGIHDILPALNIKSAVITGRTSKLLQLRCKEMGVDYLYQGIRDKVSVLDQLLQEQGLKYDQCAYMGDDINDLACMKLVGVPGCPADAVMEIKNIATFVSNKSGGNGAVREFIDWMADSAGKRGRV